ncbi:MAG: hypothetical protein ABR875_04245 [Minisyncoccia bacterium]
MRNNVLATLVYYDVLDFPLKTEEILGYLIKTDDEIIDDITIQEVKKTLDQLILESVADVDQKFYYLAGRDYLVPLRIKNEKTSREKWAKAERAIKWLKFVPFVKAVFASGTLAMNNCDELSDLDVLVVAKHGRIWLTRMLVSGMMALLRVRRKWTDKIAPDKICLNHYITDRSLRIPFENIFNAQTYANLKPMLVKNKKIIENFYKENIWLNKYLITDPEDSIYDIMIYHKWIEIGWVARVVAVAGEWLLGSWRGNWLEKMAKNYQVNKIEKNPLTVAALSHESKGGHGSGSHIVYSDEMLAFHPDSPETAIIEKYQEKLKALEGSR